uniref:Peptidase M16 C-terminal domain-containing protein n=1 Tax=Glossina morsitans morsitans TaxID=37546 RepID=A0A1B0FE62_GLOMM
MVLYFIIREMMNKNNVPYYIAGTLATFTLLASGVFAAAPYIGFLAPVAALSVGLPFIIGYAVFSVVTIALSHKAISENKTNSELKNKMKAQEQTISGQKTQLPKKEAEVKAKEEENSKLKDQIEEDKLKVAIADGTVQLAKGTVNSTVWFAKGAVNGVLYSGKYAYDNYVPSTESTKGTLSGIGGGLKNTYDASIASVREALNSVGSSLYSRIYGTKVSSPEEQFKREDGSKPSMQELTRLDYLNLEVLSSEQKQRANSLDYLSIDNVPKQLDHLNVDPAKSYLMSLSEDQDVFYDAESGDEKGTEISSPESQPAKEENGQGWSVIGWESDIKTYNLDDITRFHDNYYHSGNAILLIVGDVELDEVVKLA